MCLVKSDFVLENVKYFWIFFTFRFFEDKSDMMYHILNNREKKTSFLCGRNFTPFIFFSYPIEEMRGKPKGGALSFFDRPLFANVHLDVALIVASFSAQPRENDREKRNCKFTTIQIPPWRLQTFLFLDFSSLFFLFVWSYFYTSLHCDRAQSCTIKKVVSLQTRVAIYAYFANEIHLAFLINRANNSNV